MMNYSVAFTPFLCSTLSRCERNVKSINDALQSFLLHFASKQEKIRFKVQRNNSNENEEIFRQWRVKRALNVVNKRLSAIFYLRLETNSGKFFAREHCSNKNISPYWSDYVDTTMELLEALIELSTCLATFPAFHDSKVAKLVIKVEAIEWWLTIHVSHNEGDSAIPWVCIRRHSNSSSVTLTF